MNEVLDETALDDAAMEESSHDMNGDLDDKKPLKALKGAKTIKQEKSTIEKAEEILHSDEEDDDDMGPEATDMNVPLVGAMSPGAMSPGAMSPGAMSPPSVGPVSPPAGDAGF